MEVLHVKCKKPCDDPLDCFIEPIDIMEYFEADLCLLDQRSAKSGDGAAAASPCRIRDGVTDLSVNEVRDYRKKGIEEHIKNNNKMVTYDEIQSYQAYAKELLNDYGRGFTQTLTDYNLDTYKESFIVKALRCALTPLCDKILVVPDYSPKDGRLHFHGVITFKSVKDVSKLKRKLKPFGWTCIDTDPKENTPAYIFKIYERNKYTPANFKIEELRKKYIIKK